MTARNLHRVHPFLLALLLVASAATLTPGAHAQCTTSTDCADGDGCTINSCFAGLCTTSILITECCHTVGDTSLCNPQTCQTTRCVADAFSDSVQCAYDPIPGCCASSVDCADGDALTINECVDGLCEAKPRTDLLDACLTAGDCRDGRTCTDATCVLRTDGSGSSLDTGDCTFALQPGATDCFDANGVPDDALCPDASDPCITVFCDVGCCREQRRAGCCTDATQCPQPAPGDVCSSAVCEGLTTQPGDTGQCGFATTSAPACCAENADCFDGDRTTRDVCDPATDRCVRVPDAGNCATADDCADGDICTTATCVAVVGEDYSLCEIASVSNCCASADDCAEGEFCNTARQCEVLPPPPDNECLADSDCALDVFSPCVIPECVFDGLVNTRTCEYSAIPDCCVDSPACCTSDVECGVASGPCETVTCAFVSGLEDVAGTCVTESIVGCCAVDADCLTTGGELCVDHVCTSVPEPAPEPSPEPAPEPSPEPAPQPAPEPAPQPAPQPAPESSPSPSPQCTVAADCEPFRQRACEFLVCTATGTCDVCADECCATDADCPDADPSDCDVATCEPNSGFCIDVTIENCCIADRDCPAPTAPFCDAASKTCVACRGDVDCVDGDGCTSNFCNDAHECDQVPVEPSLCCSTAANCTRFNVGCLVTPCTFVDTADYVDSGVCDRNSQVYDPTVADVDCCQLDRECDDGNVCTVDHCDLSVFTCTYTAVAGCCTVDADCPAGETCLEDATGCVPVEPPCTVSYGFLKNNATAQQLLTDAFGGEDALALYLDGYALEAALGLRPMGGDAYVILLHQWLTYAFNTLVGATSSGPVAVEPAAVFGPADERAREILSTSGVGQIAKRTSLRAETIELEARFAEFNDAAVDAGTDLRTCYDLGLGADEDDDEDEGFYAHLQVDDAAEREIIDAQVASLQYESGFTDFAYEVDDASGLPTDRLTSAGIALVVSFSVVGFVLIQSVAVLAYRRFRAPQRRGYQRGVSTDEFMLDRDDSLDEIELESMGDSRDGAPLSITAQDDALTNVVAHENQRGYSST